MSARVEISASEGLLEIRGRSLGDMFDDYRAAVAGARFDRKKNANLATPGAMEAIIRRLRDLDVEVRYDAAARALLQPFTIQLQHDAKMAVGRLERVAEEISARTGNRLMEHQREGILWLAKRYAALLADEQGLGKTAQIIIALPANVPVYICAPKGLRGVWLAQFQLWRPSLKPIVIRSKKDFRWPLPGEVLLSHYEALPPVHGDGCDGFLPAPPRVPCKGCKEVFAMEGTMSLVSGFMTKQGHKMKCDGFEPDKPRERCPGCHALFTAMPNDLTVVFDEAHNAKNPRSQRGMAVRCLGIQARRRKGRSWAMTGTPLMNAPNELWTVLEAAGVNLECFASYAKFKEAFNGESMRFGTEWGEPGTEVAELLRRGTLRRMKKDVLDLPEKLRTIVDVEIDAATIKICDAFVKRFGGEQGASAMLEKSMGKDSIPFEEISRIRAELARAKIKALFELLDHFEEENEPVVMFSAHREPILMCAKRPGWEAILGDMKEDPNAVVDRFQSGKTKNVAVTIKKGGTGLTLTRARTMIFIDQSFVPGENEQAEDRCHRIGQKEQLQIYILRARHVLDERIVQILLKKRKLIEGSVDASTIITSGDDQRKLLDETFAQIRAMQEDISAGRAARRIALTEDEERIARGLLDLVFLDAYWASKAGSLAEQLVAAGGLSDAQWRFAADVVSHGIARVERVAEERVDLDDVKASMSKEGKEEGAMLHEEPLDIANEPVVVVESVVRSASAPVTAAREEEPMSEITSATAADVIGVLRNMSPDERAYLFEVADNRSELAPDRAGAFDRIAVTALDPLTTHANDALVRLVADLFVALKAMKPIQRARFRRAYERLAVLDAAALAALADAAQEVYCLDCGEEVPLADRARHEEEECEHESEEDEESEDDQ